MFRESDYVPPRMHRTFKDRQVPEMQQRSQVSTFDDVPERRLDYQQNSPDIVVPSTYDTHYDPTNPDADWSGLVSKDRMQKRHSREHRSQIVGIVQQEDGIIPKVGMEAEFKHRTVANKQHSTSDLIGGIAAPDQYRTTAHRQQDREGTSKDQLVLKKRIGSRKALDPQFEESSYTPRVQNQNAINFRQAHTQQSDQQYHFTPQGMGGRNFTSNLGSSLLSRVPDKPTPTPIDPGAYTKTMLTQNHRPQPGYTGRRQL